MVQKPARTKGAGRVHDQLQASRCRACFASASRVPGDSLRSGVMPSRIRDGCARRRCGSANAARLHRSPTEVSHSCFSSCVTKSPSIGKTKSNVHATSLHLRPFLEQVHNTGDAVLRSQADTMFRRMDLQEWNRCVECLIRSCRASDKTSYGNPEYGAVLLSNMRRRMSDVCTSTVDMSDVRKSLDRFAESPLCGGMRTTCARFEKPRSQRGHAVTNLRRL